MTKKLIIFDVCGTLIKENSSVFFLEFLFKHGYGGFMSRFIYGIMKKMRIPLFIISKILNRDIGRRLFLRFFHNMTIEKKILHSFFQEYIKKITTNEKILYFLNNKLYDKLLLSASIDPPISLLSDYLSIPYFASKLKRKGEIILGNLEYDLLGNKEFIFKKGLFNINGYEDIYLFTDNISDKSLIKYILSQKKVLKVFIVLNKTRKEKWENIFYSLEFENYEIL